MIQEEEDHRTKHVDMLGTALQVQPVLKISGYQAIPTLRNEDQSLIVLELEFVNDGICSSILEQMDKSFCVLPQWPLHCAMGVIENAKLKQLKEDFLKNLDTLAVNANYIVGLPPPPADDRTTMVDHMDAIWNVIHECKVEV